MTLVADLHIHSHFSISTSKLLDPPHLDLWARRKGIGLLGTGDFTHPGWAEELESSLERTDTGFYALGEDHRLPAPGEAPGGPPGRARSFFRDRVLFVPSAEVCTIYRRDDRTRKVHHVILVPTLEDAATIRHRLGRLGKIASDGRPILGIDSRDLLELVLSACADAIFIPAHIWTPWFSVLGDKTGFSTIEECYGDLAGHITAVETGLSSDPPMNRRCGFLDRFALVSNSDAHSPEKLGREATLLRMDPSYEALASALGTRHGLVGTIEFHPQEGKYHYDGHRACGVRLTPQETREHAGICPVCSRPVTVGVLSRVQDLADRDEPAAVDSAIHQALIPLKEILSEILAVGPQTKTVSRAYDTIQACLGPELDILLHADVADIAEAAGPVLAEAIRRMREGEVRIEAGFDGEYGQIRVF